jgi:phosphonate transport system substrate-binding protein
MSQRRLSKFLLLLAAFACSTALPAKDYTLAIHPVLPPDQTEKAYRPLADYLARKTGHNYTIVTNSNFLTHWQTSKKGKYDLVLDGPQFTGYRLAKLDYTVLARFPDVVSYTLVTGENVMVLEAKELIGKVIATTPPPALGALRLQQLYPNPLRQPRILETNDSTAAVEHVLQGKADAAIIPAAMVGAYPQLITVLNTEQVPAPALSASPQVKVDVQQAIRKALLEATESDAGRKVLEAINIERFEASDGGEYLPQAELLKGMWEY